ncbi:MULTISPECIES: hypothetical protein [Pseudomonas]|uniref:hypothetical protein n=1 Tax=Pseudomonas TaxID=286 RepID=UPI0018E64166|nr:MULTISPECIES: hypothetical protein [Pseudomonas]MBI6706676.1 hypothetical protein [Pseudomonas syringae]MBP1139212.1 hypothetical protein [Pseudomonas sp. PvP009]UZS71516.1 hypothetical protein OQB66_18345 [Pseudomonas syringae]
MTVRFWPILLKKTAVVSKVEKYAFEIKIVTFSRRFRAQIWRSGLQKGVFSGQYSSGLEEPTFSTESTNSGLFSGALSAGVRVMGASTLITSIGKHFLRNR